MIYLKYDLKTLKKLLFIDNLDADDKTSLEDLIAKIQEENKLSKRNKAKIEAYDEIALNIKALRKHMLDSGKSKNSKLIETDYTIKHIESIIKTIDSYHI